MAPRIPLHLKMFEEEADFVVQLDGHSNDSCGHADHVRSQDWVSELGGRNQASSSFRVYLCKQGACML